MKPVSRRIYAIAAVILAAIIFVAINIAANSGLTDAKLDLTENGQFTLSPGTKHIIAQLKEPVTLRFFYSKKVAADYAQIDAYAQRVRDMLQNYAARSNGKIVLEQVDPERFTAEEDEATANGLTAAPTDSGSSVYFGLVASNTVGDKEVVPFFNAEREPYLEYDLSALIYRLSHPKKAKVAILTSLPLDGGMQMMMQGGAQPNMIYAQLQQSYATQMLDPGFTSIPSDVDVLVIAQPPQINLPQKLAIDQFVMRGGRALVFIDPNSEMAQMSNGGAPAASNLPQLLQAWGVVYNPEKVLGDRALAQAVQTSGDPGNPTVRYPIWLHLNAGDFNKTDQVTSQLQTVNLASAGAISPVKGATTTFTPLMSSSDQASLLDSPLVRMTPRPQDLWNLVHPAGSPYTIAARITGPAKSAFPQVAPIKSAKDINVIVVADSDIFDDRFWVRTQDVFGKRIAQPFADNVAFVLNAVENLTGSSDLISLRTRASSDRPFTVVNEMQAEAQAEYQQETDALQARLSDTEQRIHALEQGQAANGQNSKTLSPAQTDEIEKFKHDLIRTRAQLRDVQAQLRSDVETLGVILAFINIAFVPILVVIFALVMAWLRRRRRAKAAAV